MPYIGNNLATQFQAFATQTITGDGSTGYTLDKAVANGKELLVYINNVKQEEGSGKAYTAVGSTITFSAAVASGDSCYLVYMGSATQTVNPPDASVGSSQISSSDLVLPKTVTIGSAVAEDTKLVFDGNAQDYYVGLDDSADKLTMGVGSTLGTNTAMSIDSSGRITEPNKPAFLATYTNNAWSTVTANDIIQFNDASSGACFDTGGDFVTGTYRFVAPVAGTYYFAYQIYTINNDTTAAFKFRKNGSDVILHGSQAKFTQMSEDGAIDMTATDIMIISLSASDYIQVAGAGSSDVYGYYSTFCGHLIG